MTFEDILRAALHVGATDVHLKAGVMPVIRRNGTLRPLATNAPVLTAQSVEHMAMSLLDERQKEHFREHREIDLGYGISGLGRFRISVFKQRGTMRIVCRVIPHKVPSIVELNLPPMVEKISQYERGLVLITGVAGSGKSSTLAAIIDSINQRENKHILTIEDPIEYLIRDRKSLITQREIGVDTNTFARALRAGLRQDPDVILIGEMRDRETIENALQAAETGHLVLSTLHTLDAVETINRIIGTFEANQQSQIRLQLASVLKAVISQRLCTNKDGSGMVPACEILINNARVRELIEDPAHTQEIQQSIEEGSAAYGMQSFDQSLTELLNKDLITFDEALLHCARPEEFRIRYEGITAMDGKKWSQTGLYDKKVDDKWQNVAEVEIIMPQDTQVKSVDETQESKKKDESRPQRSEYAQALDSLTRYLALRDHSRYELKTKLLRRFDPELVERLLAEADENGWLASEEQVAERLVLALQRRQKSGRYIEAQLMKRRLPKVKREEETEEEIIRGLVERKFGIEKLSFEEKAKAYRFLRYRGFADRMIRKVLNEKQ